MSVVSALEEELKTFPPYLRFGALAASAMVMAQMVDSARSEHARIQAHIGLQSALKELRELAPPPETHDELDELRKQRRRRIREHRHPNPTS